MNDSDDKNKELVSVLGNHIYFYTDVNETSALQVIKIIKKLTTKILIQKALSNENDIYSDSEDTDTKIINAPIYLHINSNGGNYFDGMAIVDTIRLNKVDVYTIAEGAVASMASIIFLAGKKKFINKNAYILIHEIRSSVSGTFSNIKDEYENCKLLMDKIIEFYKENANIPKKELESILKKDLWIDSDKCIKWKLANKII